MLYLSRDTPECCIFHRAVPILVSVSVSGQYQHFLIVSELVEYAIQVPILLFMHYIYYYDEFHAPIEIIFKYSTYIINYDCTL